MACANKEEGLGEHCGYKVVHTMVEVEVAVDIKSYYMAKERQMCIKSVDDT